MLGFRFDSDMVIHLSYPLSSLCVRLLKPVRMPNSGRKLVTIHWNGANLWAAGTHACH